MEIFRFKKEKFNLENFIHYYNDNIEELLMEYPHYVSRICLIDRDYVDGITITGGDPLMLGNRYEVTKLCKLLKEKFPNKSIWLYTGYEFEEIEALEVLQYIDLLIDGPFKLDLRDISLAFKGSSNQRVIDVQKTLKNGNIVLYK